MPTTLNVKNIFVKDFLIFTTFKPKQDQEFISCELYFSTNSKYVLVLCSSFVNLFVA